MLIQPKQIDDLYEIVKEAEKRRKQHLQDVKEGTQWIGKDNVLLCADGAKTGNLLNENVVMKSPYFDGSGE